MIQTSFMFKERELKEDPITLKVRELAAPAMRRFHAYTEQIGEIHKTLPDVKPVAVDPLTLLSGKDPEALQIKKRLLKETKATLQDHPERVFARYYIYATVPQEAILDYNLLDLIEDDFAHFTQLIESQPGLQTDRYPFELKNHGWELWWDNAKVEFSYHEHDTLPFRLKFENGRSFSANARHLGRCPELSANIQLSIASVISSYIGFELDLNKVGFIKSSGTYNYLDAIEHAAGEAKIKLYEYLAANCLGTRSVQLPDTGVTLDLDTMEFRAISLTTPGAIMKTDNTLSELLLTTAFLKHLQGAVQ